MLRQTAMAMNILKSTQPLHCATPMVTQVRYKQIRVAKPRRGSIFRQKLLAISQPVWEEEDKIEDIWRDCQYVAKENERKEYQTHVNQLEKFYVKEMVDYFENSKMIAFYHSNPIRRIKLHGAWQNARRLGMELEHYHYRVGLAGLKGTQWENCLHFWFNTSDEKLRQSVVFSPDLSPDKLLKYEKKVPEFFLLGAVIENRILSKKEIQDMVKMPNLETSRGELVSILGFHQQKTCQLLQSNQQQLSRNLDQLVKDRSPPVDQND